MVKSKTLKSLYQNKDGSEYSFGGTRYINVCLGKNNDTQNKKNEKLIDTNKNLPDLYKRKEDCCGCTACYTSCPMSKEVSSHYIDYSFISGNPSSRIYLTGAISMLPDEEGFLYPVIDASLCIRCYKCEKVCPYIDD